MMSVMVMVTDREGEPHVRGFTISGWWLAAIRAVLGLVVFGLLLVGLALPFVGGW